MVPGRAARESAPAAENEHARGDALHNLGRFDEARRAYLLALKLSGEDPQLESKLGLVEVRLGQLDSGFRRLQNAIGTLPYAAELHERLIKSNLLANRMEAAANAAEHFANTVRHPKTYIRAAAIRAHMEQNEQARNLLLQGLEIFPESPELQRAAAEFSPATITS
jgi:Flp pilus assembly protein TadD